MGIANKRLALREMFDLSGSLKDAQERADRYVRRALEALPPLEPSRSLASLELIARYVLERDR